MNEKKRRLIDDDVVVSLIYDFEMEEWSNGVMEEGICAEFKGYYSINPLIERLDSRA